ncbi:hypothetical protein E2C01_078922 [Portunus trituberculatus]|uniref:Uncharacterized protein n=1 Tax=Portunus trituberculatus TaxID=210409 RepID=A0A5B7IVF7_PORTR|nr:hypothetical protein [Portunus trituberculatus]
MTFLVPFVIKAKNRGSSLCIFLHHLTPASLPPSYSSDFKTTHLPTRVQGPDSSTGRGISEVEEGGERGEGSWESHASQLFQTQRSLSHSSPRRHLGPVCHASASKHMKRQRRAAVINGLLRPGYEGDHAGPETRLDGSGQ